MPGSCDGEANRPPRILIVRVGAMGDVLHGLPAVAALRAQLPNATIGWAVDPRWLPMLQAQGLGGGPRLCGWLRGLAAGGRGAPR